MTAIKNKKKMKLGLNCYTAMSQNVKARLNINEAYSNTLLFPKLTKYLYINNIESKNNFIPLIIFYLILLKLSICI